MTTSEAKEPTVLIGILHIGDIPEQFFSSYGGLRKPRRRMEVDVGRAPTHHARNFVVNQIFQVGLEKMQRSNDDTREPAEMSEARKAFQDVTHVFFMDDDMIFPSDALMRLLAHDVPIVSGFYVKRFPPFWPVPMRRVGPEGYTSMVKFCKGLQEVDVVGGGCLLVKREVFEAVAYPWFEYVDPAYRGKVITEDVPFCEKVQAAGFPILLDFDVQCGHLVTSPVGYEHWLLAKKHLDMTPEDAEHQKVMAAANDVRPYRPKKSSRKKASSS